MSDAKSTPEQSEWRIVQDVIATIRERGITIKDGFKLRKKEDPTVLTTLLQNNPGLLTRHPELDDHSFQFKNSYIVIKDKIYRLEHTILGEGAFGRVKIATDQDGNKYAIKIQSETSAAINEPYFLQKLQEMQATATRTTTSTKKPYDVMKTKHYLLEEYKPGRTLDEVIADLKKDTTKTEIEKSLLIQKIILLVMLAVQRLHAQTTTQEGIEYPVPIIHNDIKEQNILVDINADGNSRVSIIDLGAATEDESMLSEKPAHISEEVKGTYMAPELTGTGILVAPPSTNSDIYSLGITLMMLLYSDEITKQARKNTGKDKPSQSEIDDQIRTMIDNPKTLLGILPENTDDRNAVVNKIIIGMLEIDPDRRISLPIAIKQMHTKLLAVPHGLPTFTPQQHGLLTATLSNAERIASTPSSLDLSTPSSVSVSPPGSLEHTFTPLAQSQVSGTMPKDDRLPRTVRLKIPPLKLKKPGDTSGTEPK